MSPGEFIEVEDGARVFFTEEPLDDGAELGKVVARVIDPQWFSVITAKSAHVQNEENGDRFLVLNEGYRYDVKPKTPWSRITEFEHYGVRLENRDEQATSSEQIRARAEQQIKARPTSQLLGDDTNRARSQVMWRSALPLAALNLALLAIPLGAVNPRLGRSGNILIAGLLALLYMNLINLSRGWISSGSLSFPVGTLLVHAAFSVLVAFLFWQKMRIKRPKQ